MYGILVTFLNLEFGRFSFSIIRKTKQFHVPMNYSTYFFLGFLRMMSINIIIIFLLKKIKNYLYFC